jgi:hypothetical protein
MRSTRIDFQEFVKQRPIVDHCPTHFFRVGFRPPTSERKCASSAVILDDHRMVNRQVICTLVEVFKGIATRGHHLRDELIGFVHGAVRVVHEARLNATPLSDKRFGLILSELAQVETADALGALPQNGLGACRADGLNGSFVFGSETFAQIHAPAPARVSPGGQPEQQHNETDTDEHEGF